MLHTKVKRFLPRGHFKILGMLVVNLTAVIGGT